MTLFPPLRILAACLATSSSLLFVSAFGADAAASSASPAASASGASGDSSGDAPTSEALKFFRPGEVLTFRMGYGIFSNAGSMRIETERVDTPDGPRIRIVVKTATQGLVDTFYDLNNLVVSTIDARTGRSLQIATVGNESKRKTEEVTVFDYDKHEIVHTDKIRPQKSGTIPLPEQPIYDLTVTMLGARTWNLKVGETKDVLAPFGNELYNLRVTALREETIKTGAGKFQTIVLEPKMIGELKGLFKKGGGFRFYISKGDKPQFVRMDIKTPWGTFVGSLEKVEMKEQPPAAAEGGATKNAGE